MRTIRRAAPGPAGAKRPPWGGAGAARRSAGRDRLVTDVPIGQRCCPYPRVSAPRAGLFTLLSRQIVRPAEPIGQKSCPYPRISRPLAGVSAYLSRQTIRPARANRSAVLPLSADKAPSPGCSCLCPGKPSARPRQICQQYCPYPRIRSAPLAGLFGPLFRQTVRPARANMSAVLTLSADKPPLAGLFAPLLRQTVRPVQANMSAVLTLSADKPPPRRAVHASAPANRPPGPRPIGQQCCPYPRISPSCRAVRASLPANNPPGPGQYVSSTDLIRG